LLGKALAARLAQDTEFAQELMGSFGGEEAVQQVIASHGSRIEAVTQEIEGGGEQVVKANSRSVIKGVQQSIKK
jgi:hypothetical protein